MQAVDKPVKVLNLDVCLCCPQVVFGHAEGDRVQLSVLVRPDHHLHHGHHTHQHLLYGIPARLLLLLDFWRRAVTEANQKHPSLLGLPHSIQRLRDHHEKHSLSEYLINLLNHSNLSFRGDAN